MQLTLNLVVFAGGKSSRMGRDKTTLPLSEVFSEELKDILIQKGILPFYENGTDFLLHALCLLHAVKKKHPHIFMPIFISCRENQKDMILERVSTLSFAHEIGFLFDKGVGVCEALDVCLTQGDCLTIPCDVPCLSDNLLSRLIVSWLDTHGEYAQYVFIHKNKKIKESLIGIYTQHAQKYLLDAIEKRLSLQKTFPMPSVKNIFYTEKENISFFNLNSVQEIHDLQNILKTFL